MNNNSINDEAFKHIRRGRCSMKRLNRLLLSLSTVTCLTFNIALAEDIGTSQIVCIGLDETISRALDTSEELKIRNSQVKKAEGAYREVRANMLPNISAESSWYFNVDTPDLGSVKVPDYLNVSGVTASQVIWSFGKVMYAVNSARKMVEASSFDKESSRQDIIYNAKLSYYSNLLARNTLAISEKSYANVLENEKLLEKRSYGGRSPKYEIIRIKADVASRIPTVNEARTQFDAAAETLKKIIGIDPNHRVEITGDFEKEYKDYDRDVLIGMMYESEPSLKSIGKTIEATDANVKSKYASFMPTVSGFASWDYIGGKGNSKLFNDTFGNYAFAGVKVSMPIWEGGKTEAQLSQSKADKEIAVFRNSQVSKELLLQLKKAFLELSI
jgi:outer membrane protein